MFRNPRENLNLSNENHVKPSTGRPPTPTYSSQTLETNSLRPKTLFKSRNMKTISSDAKKLKKSKRNITVKVTGKPNNSILDFFKKVDTPMNEDTIFLNGRTQFPDRPPSPEMLFIEANIDEARFNEAAGSVKRRRISEDKRLRHGATAGGIETLESYSDGNNKMSIHKNDPAESLSEAKVNPRKVGPFFEDSDTDDENRISIPKSSVLFEIETNKDEKSSYHSQTLIKSDLEPAINNFHKFQLLDKIHSDETSSGETRLLVEDPAIIQEAPLAKIDTKKGVNSKRSESSQLPGEPISTRIYKPCRSSTQLINFEDDDFSENEFISGEESISRKWMEEQGKLENEDENLEISSSPQKECKQQQNHLNTVCPICNTEFRGVCTDLISKHVNQCLDFSLVPKIASTQTEVVEIKSTEPDLKSNFARKAAVPRPGQESPFEIEAVNSKSSSAFSRLMSGKIEDTAWINAAASETSSRGKPAYQRTCPFYKIIPGFSICVDAFRYGAVQDCNAYFLSHFHSDHYIGLSSSWCHGPIYCSKITANLVRQQLRVDAKYVVSLEFDEKFQIPGTPSVYVTMISANHCPGSSLFLYEKITGKSASTHIQRVLHCGDFRACPAHISHPLLMPDVLDSVTKKYKHQKIDVCYLDTTYLDPRYAFPPQEQVIRACADLCVSLKSERTEKDGSWEVIKRERICTGMSKYLEPAISKPADERGLISPPSIKSQGRLLIVCGTYSIGKERICLGIARALDCKIFAPARKMRICAALENEELMSRMTNDPIEAQIHMQILMELRVETLQEYLNNYKPHFSRVVGFRPSGWTYKPPTSRGTQSATILQILTSPSWQSSFCLSDLVPQRGSTREASCYGVPYSEHSSFRELTMFVCALRIEKIIPTVNVGSASSRAKMKGWIERWLAERRRNGPVKIGDGKDEIKWS